METSPTFGNSARRVGMVSAVGIVLLLVAYAVTLAAGLLALEAPDKPIVDPYFSILEILILLLMPLMLALMAAIHAWAPAEARIFSLLALVFMALVVGITCSLHFVILTIGQHPQFSALAWTPSLLSFSWPSVAYALDILAWDVFFALSVLCAAQVFSARACSAPHCSDSRLAVAIRVSLVTSGVLALAGLGGVVTGDMQVRNIGIVGYVGVFLVSAALLAVFFRRAGLPSAASEYGRQ